MPVLTRSGARAALLAAAGLAALMMPPAGSMAGAAEYWAMKCRGPLPGFTVAGNIITLVAQAGRRANAPRRGECVWIDRGINRAHEHYRRRLTVTIRFAGRTVLQNIAGRQRHFIAGNRRAQQLWEANAAGREFVIGARHTGRGSGGFIGRFTPTAWPRGRARVEARPAPPARTPRAEPAPYRDDRRRIPRAEPAPYR